jgi:hypothetical protein
MGEALWVGESWRRIAWGQARFGEWRTRGRRLKDVRVEAGDWDGPGTSSL